MVFDFVILPEAEEQLRALDRETAKKILKKLKWIASQSNPLRSARFLHNAKIGDLRFRIGDYRAIAILDQKKRRIGIVVIGHRRDIYQ